MSEELLSVWVVYERPEDHPTKFVARRWISLPQKTPTDDLLVADDLTELRRSMPAGLVQMARHPSDGPKVVETWM